MGLIAPNFDVAQIILPSIFIEKRPEASPDVIAWFYGFRAPGVVSRPVVGLVASAIATGGLLGALIIPGLAVFASLALLNKLAGTMRDNPWGVFLLSEAVYLSEKELAPFLAFHVRPLWIILAVVAGMCWLFSETRPKSRPRLADSRFPAPRIGP